MQKKSLDIKSLLDIPTEYRSQIRLEVTLDDLIKFAEHLSVSWQHNNTLTHEKPDIGRIDLAVEVTGLTKSTIYSKVSKNEIPFMKKHGALYFSRSTLQDWIIGGRQETKQEINNNLDTYLK
ncbi:MAG: helix-turn-helix domain-containing protein [Bacteroidetes bacterium]|nr:helix-turn-helix domain-containing protein [Bacteroidota bacterium]